MFDTTTQQKNELHKIAMQLEKENIDIWENDTHYQGIGFKAIFQSVWVDVSLIVNYSTPNEFIISLYKKNPNHPNILDCFACKEIAKKRTQNANDVYNFIKSVY